MTNAEWMIKNGYKFKNIDIRQSQRDSCIYGVYIGNALIDTYRCTNEITYWDVIMNWLDMEHKEPLILDESERQYLSAVIRPFRDVIQYVVKYDDDGFGDFEEIIVNYKYNPRDGAVAFFGFPPFKKGTMYKGMKADKQYTLKELGL